LQAKFWRKTFDFLQTLLERLRNDNCSAKALRHPEQIMLQKILTITVAKGDMQYKVGERQRNF
jgi:hypothetical protein